MPVCFTCEKAFSSNSRPQKCTKCGNTFHTTCTRFTSVRDEHDSIVKVCNLCLSEANQTPSRPRSSSVSSCSGSSKTSSTQLSRPVTPTATPNTLEVLATLSAKMDKLDKLDSMQSTITNLSDQFGTFTNSFKALECKVHELSSSLTQRIEVNEAKLDKLQSDHNSLQKTVDGILSTAASTSTGHVSTVEAEKFAKLESDNKTLAQQIHQLHVQQDRIAHSADLVLSGLVVEEFLDLQLAVFGILSVLMPSLSQSDILSVRPLSSSSKSDSRMTTSRNNTTPLLVTLSHSTLARSLITAKIKARKVHTSQANVTLLNAAHPNTIISPRLINLNEYLTVEIHRLKLRVLEKARDKQYNFHTFVRNGNIYVRRKKDDKPVVITSDEDLQVFLTMLPPPPDNDATHQ